MLITDRARYAGSRFADQFQIAQGGIVGERVGDERGLIHFGGIGSDLFTEFDHIGHVEVPLP